jgi:hypothetical protein
MRLTRHLMLLAAIVGFCGASQSRHCTWQHVCLAYRFRHGTLKASPPSRKCVTAPPGRFQSRRWFAPQHIDRRTTRSADTLSGARCHGIVACCLFTSAVQVYLTDFYRSCNICTRANQTVAGMHIGEIRSVSLPLIMRCGYPAMPVNYLLHGLFGEECVSDILGLLPLSPRERSCARGGDPADVLTDSCILVQQDLWEGPVAQREYRKVGGARRSPLCCMGPT